MSDDAIRDYVRAVESEYRTGKAREHAYRPALKALIEALGGKQILAINEPARVACGAPDFIVERKGSGIPLGYIEAKDIGENLDAVEQSEQLKRYRDALGNLLLTDYLVFRRYVDGELRETLRLARLDARGKLKPEPGAEDALANLLATFLASRAQRIGTSQQLARRLALLARMLKDTLEAALKHDVAESKDSMLLRHLGEMREELIKDLPTDRFADMYAQTIVYGMLTARLNHQTAGFTRQGAVFEIPESNPFLNGLFVDLAGPALDHRIRWAVDDLAELLAHADTGQIMADYKHFKQGRDWVFDFYETFLKEYDPAERERLGVYYTPPPVISYIVRSVDAVLKRDFGLAQGLADTSRIMPGGAHRVQILDPAAGSGSFLFGVVELIERRLRQAGGGGAWTSYIREHLLPRLYGFEIQMAPYTVAHLKLGQQFADAGFSFLPDERVHVYLTNTLEDPEHGQGKLQLGQSGLEREAAAARLVKRQAPILVVLGNPPYSGHSANPSYETTPSGKKVLNFIGKLVRDYYSVDGQPLGERNPKWLQDDYVKFLRWAQWRIERTGQGVLAMITNHGYLDNPTFRGMRQSLMRTFDRIYVYDLHGNSKKKERVPEDMQRELEIGAADKNVFDIQQGVAICVMVKLPGGGAGRPAGQVFHADLWGLRERKYGILSNSDLERQMSWGMISPHSPSYLFVPLEGKLLAEYEQGWNLSDSFCDGNNGLVTARDSLCIKFESEEVIGTLQKFCSLSAEESRIRFELGEDTRDWKVEWAQADVNSTGLSRELISSLLYRPFDIRKTYYTGVTRGFICMPRTETMIQLVRYNNLAFLATRVTKDQWDVLISNCAIGHKSLSAYDITSFYPLYLYPVHPNDPRTSAPGGRRPNLSPEFIAACEERWGLKFVPDGVGDLGVGAALVRPGATGGNKKGRTSAAPTGAGATGGKRLAGTAAGPTGTFGPEDVFHYMYAVFHAPGYRSRYAEFLKRDFPRLPLASDIELVRQLCALGATLTRLHLMEPSAVDTQRFPLPRYPVGPQDGGNKVDKVKYSPPGAAEQSRLLTRDSDQAGTSTGACATGKVWINDAQYFEDVAPEVWEFRVGGYQPCEKWLKDRKGRVLSFDDIEHYRLIAGILAQTRALMAEIDALIAAHGGWPLR